MSIANVTPAPDTAPGAPGAFSSSYALARFTPIALDVTDVAPGLALVVLTVEFTMPEGVANPYPGVLVVYDDGADPPGFQPLFAGSTATPIDDGFHFEIIIDGGWPAGAEVRLSVRAIDAAGNLVTEEPEEEEAPAPPTTTIATQMEAVNGYQLTEQLGGHGAESIWKYINNLNDATGAQYPALGSTVLTGSAGSIQNVAGPLDAFDKAISATDAQSNGQWSGASAAINPNGQSFALLIEVRFTSVPAANRNLVGHASGTQYLIQYMTTGRLRGATGGTLGTNVTGEIAVNHADGNWHTVLVVYRPGVGQIIASDLGVSTAGTAPAGMIWNGAFHIMRASAAPPCSVSFVAVAYSDGSAEENAAIVDLYNNPAAAIAAYRAATGR